MWAKSKLAAKPISKSARAGLQFPVDTTKRILKDRLEGAADDAAPGAKRARVAEPEASAENKADHHKAELASLLTEFVPDDPELVEVCFLFSSLRSRVVRRWQWTT